MLGNIWSILGFNNKKLPPYFPSILVVMANIAPQGDKLSVDFFAVPIQAMPAMALVYTTQAINNCLQISIKLVQQKAFTGKTMQA